jgi:GTP:adenosylcobinamide-phosphate guanylyltransferase
MSKPPQRFVIVQAGGKGSRLEQYTWNKPKCLAPVNGKPLLYHIFDAFPSARFLLIVDYKQEIVRNFLKTFPPNVDYEIVSVFGTHGNVAGVPEAAARIPPDSPVIVTWCDLLFQEPPAIEAKDAVSVLTTDAFPCRWSMLHGGHLVERRSDTNGVVGVFGFPRASMLHGLPREGEFVAWLADAGFPLEQVRSEALKEIGTIDALIGQWAETGHARFFNKVEMLPDRVVKRARVSAFEPLLRSEAAWYRHVEALGYANVPRLLSDEPLTIERIAGRHPFEFADGERGREQVLRRIIARLEALHALESGPADAQAAREMYETKTLQRLETVAGLLPEARTQAWFRVNGQACRNVLHPSNAAHFSALVERVMPARFTLIHGDPTFSNTLIDANNEPYFIDPRGTFGRSRFIGDPLYDWAKLLYSVVGEYDGFNRRRFILECDASGAVVQVRPSGWAHLRGVVREHCGDGFQQVRILHGLIWLALSGYVSDDYDSILAAFFLGLQVLEDAVA